MMTKRRTFRAIQGACFAMLAAGIQLACSESTPSADDGSGGTVASGGVPASGGGSPSSSGGKANTASGGQGGASGGLGGAAPSGPCDDPALDPPCSDDDLHGEWLECKQRTTIRFSFPLVDVAAPVEGLRLVFLPLDADLGVGGWSGSAGLIDESLDLREGSFSPLGVGELDGETFDLNESAEGVGASLDISDGIPADYVESHELRQYPWVWGRAHVALVQGDTILSEHHLLIDVSSVCPI